jgi:hypothetical protein
MNTNWLAASQTANNLGNQGPGDDPFYCECLRFAGIGTYNGASVDLVISVAPDSTYHADQTLNAQSNVKLPRLGQISMQQGTYTDFEYATAIRIATAEPCRC